MLSLEQGHSGVESAQSESAARAFEGEHRHLSVAAALAGPPRLLLLIIH